MSKNIYVGNLPYSMTDQSLEELFTPFGTVISAKVITDKYSGQSKGFGFVEMEEAEDAKNAIEALNQKEIQGRAVTVNEARPPSERRRPEGGRSDSWSQQKRRY